MADNATRRSRLLPSLPFPQLQKCTPPPSIQKLCLRTRHSAESFTAIVSFNCHNPTPYEIASITLSDIQRRKVRLRKQSNVTRVTESSKDAIPTCALSPNTELFLPAAPPPLVSEGLWENPGRHGAHSKRCTHERHTELWGGGCFSCRRRVLKVAVAMHGWS